MNPVNNKYSNKEVNSFKNYNNESNMNTSKNSINNRYNTRNANLAKIDNRFQMFPFTKKNEEVNNMNISKSVVYESKNKQRNSNKNISNSNINPTFSPLFKLRDKNKYTMAKSGNIFNLEKLELEYKENEAETEIKKIIIDDKSESVLKLRELNESMLSKTLIMNQESNDLLNFFDDNKINFDFNNPPMNKERLEFSILDKIIPTKKSLTKEEHKPGMLLFDNNIKEKNNNLKNTDIGLRGRQNISNKLQKLFDGELNSEKKKPISSNGNNLSLVNNNKVIANSINEGYKKSQTYVNYKKNKGQDKEAKKAINQIIKITENPHTSSDSASEAESDNQFKNNNKDKKDLKLLKNEIKINLFLKYTDKKDTENIENKREKSRHISKINKVYDSLSDEECDIMLNRFRIDPFSKKKYILDFLIVLIVVYSVSFLPIRLIFCNVENLDFFFVELVFDLVMGVDFLLGFITGYYDFEENYIVKRSNMIRNYLTSYFFIDFISGIPFNSLSEFYIYYYENKQHTNEDQYILINGENKLLNSFLDYNKNKLYRLCKILRIIKFIKIISKNEFIDSFKQKIKFTTTSSAGINRMIFFLIYFLIISHILSCVYIFLGSLSIPSWIISINLQNSSFSEIYCASLYFNHTTIFTIGYGDVLSKNIYEKSYNILLMVVGIMIYSFAVTSISNIIQQRDENTKNFQRNMEYLNQMRVKYKLKTGLYEKIVRYLKYSKNVNKKDKNELLKELPISLRNEMILFMYNNIINSFIFFKNFTNIDFIIKAIMCFKPVRSIKNEIFIKETEFIEEMIFIKKGVLSLECSILIEGYDESNEINNLASTFDNPNSYNVQNLKSENKGDLKEFKSKKFSQSRANPKYQNIKIIEIRRNEHFGDVLIFLNERSPLSVKTKTKYAELFLMKKMDLIQLTTDFPEIFEQIYIKSSYNMYQIKKCIEKTKRLYYSRLSLVDIYPKPSMGFYRNLLTESLDEDKNIFSTNLNSLIMNSENFEGNQLSGITEQKITDTNKISENRNAKMINFNPKSPKKSIEEKIKALKKKQMNTNLTILEESRQEEDIDSQNNESHKKLFENSNKTLSNKFNNANEINRVLSDSKLFQSKKSINIPEVGIECFDIENIKFPESKLPKIAPPIYLKNRKKSPNYPTINNSNTPLSSVKSENMMDLYDYKLEENLDKNILANNNVNSIIRNSNNKNFNFQIKNNSMNDNRNINCDNNNNGTNIKLQNLEERNNKYTNIHSTQATNINNNNNFNTFANLNNDNLGYLLNNGVKTNNFPIYYNFNINNNYKINNNPNFIIEDSSNNYNNDIPKTNSNNFKEASNNRAVNHVGKIKSYRLSNMNFNENQLFTSSNKNENLNISFTEREEVENKVYDMMKINNLFNTNIVAGSKILNNFVSLSSNKIPIDENINSKNNFDNSFIKDPIPSHRSKASNLSKTLLYLNESNCFPIQDDKIIQQVSCFTIVNTGIHSHCSSSSYSNKIIREKTKKNLRTEYSLNSHQKCHYISEKKELNLLKKENEESKTISLQEKKHLRRFSYKKNKSLNYNSNISFNANTSQSPVNKCLSPIKSQTLRDINKEVSKFNLIDLNTPIYDQKKSSSKSAIKEYFKKDDQIYGTNITNKMSSNTYLKKINMPYNYNSSNNTNYLSNNLNLNGALNFQNIPNIPQLKNKKEFYMEISENIKRTTMQFNNPENFYSDLINDFFSKQTKKKTIKNKNNRNEQIKTIKKLDGIMKKLNIK